MPTKTICDIHGAPCDSPDDHLFIGALEESDPQVTDSIVYYGKHDSKIRIGYLTDLHIEECPHRECLLLGAEGYDAYDRAGYHLGHARTIEQTVRLYFNLRLIKKALGYSTYVDDTGKLWIVGLSQIRQHGLNRGADVYLTDPIEEEELLATVVAALRYYRARQQAEQTASRLTALTRATLAVNAASTFDGLARAAVLGAVEIFGVPAVHYQVLPDGQVCRMYASPGDPVPVQKGGIAALAENAARLALRPGEDNAAVSVSKEQWQALVPDTGLRGDICLAAARTRGGPPVLIAVERAGLRHAELQILRQFVQAVALAIEALRAFADEHLIALTLQRSFLPAFLPEVPGLALAARYTPASEQAEVGGDFYKALTVRDGVLLAIGDVQGHSLRAATVMGELRHALRAFAEEGHPPEAISSLLGSVLRRYHPGIVATICLALIDPASGEVQIVNCGHIPR
jgi:CheY-like chemotaxis protein